eukprot:c9901_g1_i1.p1 GENE.c9901_g1_i1~~c9901_g1_i1.p1  ORF type:complete len:416 (+),score=108.53 c9901_g1_i1:1-1248(+)
MGQRQMLPAPLRGTDGPTTFTHKSITVRMPKIVLSVIDNNPHLDSSTIQKLTELAAEMENGHPLSFLSSQNQWNQCLVEAVNKGETWWTAPWWLVEHYMYKRILEICNPTEGFADPYLNVDPFENQKLHSLEDAKQPMELTVLPLVGSPDHTFSDFIYRSLWGNRADLSLTGGVRVSATAKEHSTTTDNEVLSVSEDGTCVLVDQCAEFVEFVTKFGVGEFAVIALDNCGLELISDLCLCDYLLTNQIVQRVELHAKSVPVFVSDVMVKDIFHTLNFLAQNGAKELSDRLQSAISDGRLVLSSHSYYSSPLAAWEMPQDLIDVFSRAKFAIVKGDCNYRRLIKDLHYDHSTDFGTHCAYFPCPLLALRTCKSGAVIGIPRHVENAAKAHFGGGEEWLTSGVCGLVHFAHGKERSN